MENLDNLDNLENVKAKVKGELSVIKGKIRDIKDMENVKDIRDISDISDISDIKNTDCLRYLKDYGLNNNIPGVYLESFKDLELEINNLKNCRIDDVSNIKEIVNRIFYLINNKINELKSVNRRGYINDSNLANYPLIKECFNEFIAIPEGGGKNVVSGGIKVGDHELNTKTVETLYK